MLKRLLIAIGLLIIAGGAAFGQAGTLKGTVTDASNKQPLEDVTVKVELDGKMIKGTTTDEKGWYTISNLETAREYEVVFSSVGYTTVRRKVFINPNNVTIADAALPSSALVTETLEITADDPLIVKGKPEMEKTYTKEEMAFIPTNNVSGIAAMTAGIGYDDGGQGTARGEGGMVTYVNGVRKRGTVNVPKEAIAALQFILGGTPAKYGEAMGGVQNITLQPPASKFQGNVQGQTTEPFDCKGANRLEIYFTGPILKKKVEQGNYERTVIGYRLSGFGNYTRDNMYRPQKYAYNMLNEDVLNDFKQQPLIINSDYSVFNKADYFRASDFGRQINKSNSWYATAYLEGGLDFRFSDNAILKVNGEFQYTPQMVSAGVEMNSENNAIGTTTYYRINADFEQRFPNMDTSSIIKDLRYSIAANYSRENTVVQSKKHKDNFFNYGHVGYFDTKRDPQYAMERYTIDGVEVDALVQNGYGRTTPMGFIASDLNPVYAAYTSQLYASDLMRPLLTYRDNLLGVGGLMNGDSPKWGYTVPNSGSLFSLPGTQPSYGKSETQQIYFQAQVSGTIGSHALEMGFQYEQTFNRSYSLSSSTANSSSNTAGLWTLMRNLTNYHIQQMDLDNPIIDNTGMYPTVSYNRLRVAADQSHFDKALREKLGLDVNGTDWIDIDNLNPNIFSMDMFSADDLLNGASPQYVSYRGYDHTGKRVTGKSSLQDFFNNSSRTLGAYSPIYMAGYLQDQFSIRDLIFNIGIRVDRFDGNQMVLKDPYLLYNSYTVGEVSGTQNEKNGGEHPTGAKNEWVVYVDDFSKGSDAKILGYRSENIWYDAYGVEISNPQEIAGSLARPTPYRKDPTLQPDEISVNAFKDYDPQYVFMPRIAFSFPVSDESQFKASYDIIANRPSSGWEADYIGYMFMNQRTSISNPDLKPQRVTNYEIAFEQALGNNSKITIGAYYKEVRDLIALVQYTGADPNPNIYSLDNLDFKTTKGFYLEYELRRLKNFRLNASYTLQYVSTTELPRTTMESLIREGYSSLKMLYPADDDRRNAFKANPIFMFSSGSKYNGPTTRRIVKDANGEERVKTIKWLENFVVSLPLVAQSGTPYTSKYSNTQNTIVGSYNGVRLPWQFYVNLQVSKAWTIEVGKKNRPTTLMAQLRVNNLLNIRNIRNVYPVTGDPDDNGYLTDPDTQNVIAAFTDPQSYRDMYSILLDRNSYSNYTNPRTITLIVSYAF